MFKLNIKMNFLEKGLPMKTVSMLEFRQHAERILKEIAQGQRMVLTYRGKPVARLEPIHEGEPDEDDPFYSLDALADPAGPSLSNAEIDRDVYGG